MKKKSVENHDWIFLIEDAVLSWKEYFSKLFYKLYYNHIINSFNYYQENCNGASDKSVNLGTGMVLEPMHHEHELFLAAFLLASFTLLRLGQNSNADAFSVRVWYLSLSSNLIRYADCCVTVTVRKMQYFTIL